MPKSEVSASVNLDLDSEEIERALGILYKVNEDMRKSTNEARHFEHNQLTVRSTSVPFTVHSKAETYSSRGLETKAGLGRQNR